ncbi:MAG: VWA domain-containing protein [Spirochaetota bacterium]
MKKFFFAFSLILFLAGPAAVWGSQIDFIVLLDTSENVSGIFDDVIDLFIRNPLTNQLKSGDNFHLIVFNNEPRIEISEQINTKDDVENILKRISLIYPFGSHKDLILALKYLYQVAMGLPLKNKKTILILTDGIHDPPESSPFHESKAETLLELGNISGDLSQQGWYIRALKLPEKENTDTQSESSGRINLFPQLVGNLNIPYTDYMREDKKDISNIALGSPSVEFPSYLGKVGNRFKVPIKIKNFNDKPIMLKLIGIDYNGKNILEEKIVRKVDGKKTITLHPYLTVPPDFDEGDKTIPVELDFSDSLRVSPVRGTLRFTFSTGFAGQVSKLFYIAIPALLSAVLITGIILIVMLLRKVLESALWVPGRQLETIYDRRTLRQDASLKAVEMRVINQNPNIGLRNVNYFRKGTAKSVGGPGSAFLIFLYNFPPDIAKIQFDGHDFVFTPLKPAYFPEIKDGVMNCLDKKIPLATEKGHNVELYFREYVSPLEKINAVMHLTDTPGLP